MSGGLAALKGQRVRTLEGDGVGIEDGGGAPVKVRGKAGSGVSPRVCRLERSHTTMAFEIERKFLVKGDAWRGLAEPVRIRQGYVATKAGTTVRVRVVGDKAFLTLKDHAVGLVRHEFEYPIPVGDAETILDTM